MMPHAKRYGIPGRVGQSERTFDLEDKRVAWPFIFYSLQEWLPGTVAEIEFRDAGKVPTRVGR